MTLYDVTNNIPAVAAAFVAFFLVWGFWSNKTEAE